MDGLSNETQAFVTELLTGIEGMFERSRQETKEMIEQSENRMKAFVENGVQKQVNLLVEKMDAMEKRQDNMENHMAHLTEKVTSIEMRMDRMEEHMDHMEKRMDGIEDKIDTAMQDIAEIKEAVSAHEEEIFTLKRVK